MQTQLSSPPAGTTGIAPQDLQEVRALFLRQAAAESAHDIDALADLFVQAPEGAPDPVFFVARAYRFWGRAAVLEHFRDTFAGTWKLEPDEDAIRITPINGDTVHVYAPSRVTIGAAGQPASTAPYLINAITTRTPSGWKIAAIIPVPAQ